MDTHAGKSQNSLYPLLVSILFVAAITIPLVVALVSEPQTRSVQENRRLATLPAFSPDELASAEYQPKFDDYFNDHFGLRETMLKGSKILRENLFRKSVSRHVIIGEEDWLFFDVEGTLRDFIGDFTRVPENADVLIEGLMTKQQWLAQLGVRYLLVPVPGKMSVYPENLPKRIRNVAGSTRLHTFMQRIQGHPGSEFVVDAMSALQEAKSHQQTYFKTDTHWNEDGAFAVYLATMQKLNQWFEDLKPIDPSRITRKPRKKTGDIARAAGHSKDSFETSTALVLDKPCSAANYTAVAAFSESEAFKARSKKLPVANGCSTENLTAIVVHDSFGAYLRQYFSEAFKHVVFMSSYDVYLMADFIQETQPDVFIDIRADRRFYYLLKPDLRMQAEID